MSTENAAAASSDSGEMAAAGQQTETAAIVGLQSAADNEPIAKGEVLELGDVSGPSHADAPELEVEAPVNVPSSESGSGNGETLTLSEKKDVQEVEDEAEPGESKTSVIPKDTNTYPEGGLIAWLVVFGAFLIHFFGISLIYITGVFIRAFYYQNVFPGATFSQLSWISTGIGVSLPVLAPAYGYAFVRLGPRVVVIWGAFCLALGFELASLCTETWQIVLTLGLICGIGQSSLWVAAVSTVVQHFNKRRGLVVGMVAAGTGAGGLALAPMAQSLIDNLGWRNALRVLGVVVGSTVGLGGALLFTRFGHEDRMDLRFWKKKTPPEVDESGQPVKKVEKKREPFFDPAFFKNKTFVKLYVFATIQPFGFLLPYTYVPSYATNIGLTAAVGAISLALMNGFSSVGRIAVGFTADKFLGNINSYVLCLFIPPVLCLTLWTTCNSQAQLMAFSVLFGIFAGGFIVSYPLVLATVYGSENLARRLGIQQTASLVGQIAGPIIAATILDRYTTVTFDPVTGAEVRHSNYVPLICYLSAIMLINTAIIAWVRQDVTGNKLWVKI